MTASSLEFYPCRVQLMGLSSSFASTTPHGSTSTTTTSQINDSTVISPSRIRRFRALEEATISSPVAKLHSINRNLFGTPNRIEMNELYQKEIQRQRSYVMQRYNFDINTTKPIGTKSSQKEQQKDVHQQHQRQPRVMTITPNLIEQELQQHEERLQKEKCNLIRAVATTTVFNKRSTKIYNNSVENFNLRDYKVMCYHNKHSNSMICSTCNKDSLATAAHILPSERYKPYERQMLITDCFSLRKNVSCGIDCNKTETRTVIKSHNGVKINNKQTKTSLFSSQQNLDTLKSPHASSISVVQESPSRISSNINCDDKINITDNEQNNNNNTIIIVNGDNKTNNDNNNGNVIDIYKSICVASHKDGHHDRHPTAVTTISEILLNKSTVPTTSIAATTHNQY